MRTRHLLERSVMKRRPIVEQTCAAGDAAEGGFSVISRGSAALVLVPGAGRCSLELW
jgi:hypothetical protein